MGEPRVIKRYSNRKLYDTKSSRYVTLDQIADLVREGEDVRIVDNNSKEDLTSITLAQIIFEEEKKQKSFLPLGAMRNIIQSGGARIEELVSQAKGRVSGVFARREPEAPAPAPAPELDGADGRDGARSLREIREWIDGSQRAIDEWKRRIDQRVHSVVEGMSPLSGLHKEVGALKSRIAELETKLKEAEGQK
jgi:polyhydroxyalkanoate synthesis repressor PhaR